jgi:hypothetical protein
MPHTPMTHLIIYEDPEGLMIGEYDSRSSLCADTGNEVLDVKILAEADVSETFAKELMKFIPER